MKKRFKTDKNFEISSVAFMKALQPKINRSGKQKKATAQQRPSTVLLRNMQEDTQRFLHSI